MQTLNVERLREAVKAARQAIQRSHLDECDLGDLEDILEPVEHELNAPSPNRATLSTYLNSLARSLRSQPAARDALMQLDAALRDSGVPSQWEH